MTNVIRIDGGHEIEISDESPFGMTSMSALVGRLIVVHLSSLFTEAEYSTSKAKFSTGGMYKIRELLDMKGKGMSDMSWKACQAAHCVSLKDLGAEGTLSLAQAVCDVLGASADSLANVCAPGLSRAVFRALDMLPSTKEGAFLMPVGQSKALVPRSSVDSWLTPFTMEQQASSLSAAEAALASAWALEKGIVVVAV